MSPVASFKDESLKHGKFEDLIRNDRRVPLMMRNGQRITGPPTNWQGPLPSKGSEVKLLAMSEIIWCTTQFIRIIMV